MSRFQDFYNQQRGWNGSSNEQNRKHLFNNVRKERRTRTFDLFRGDIGAAYEQEELQPIPKITLRDTISKLLRVNKKKASKKVNRPFVVGTVKHKIHSPPFLHGPLKTKSPKKKKIPPLHIKSFAPSNYKFKPPKGLKINLLTPMGEEKTITSPFLLNTVWNKVDNKTTSRRNAVHENITVRPRGRRLTRLNSSPNSIFGTGTMSEEIENGACPDAKKELWPEDEDDEPVFGRLNLHKKRLERESLSKGNEKEDELNDINQSVDPDSSFRCIKEKSQNPTMENLSQSSNFASATQNTAENPDADTFKTPVQSVFEQTISAKKTTVMDYRVSQISPPKSIFSNTTSNSDVSRIHTCIDNTVPEEEHLSFSTPSAKAVFEVTPKQVQNAIVEPVTSHKSVEESVSPHCSLPISSALPEDTNDNNLSSSDEKESLLKETTIRSNIETTTSITESCSKVPIEKETEKECSLDYQNAETESIDSAISPVEKCAINHDDLRVNDNNQVISPTEKDETLSAEAGENKQKALNSTYTKFSVLIEEDEGETESLDGAESVLKSSENVNDCQAPLKEKLSRSTYNSLTTNILNQNNLNKDANSDSSSSSSSPSSPEVTVKLAPRINVEYDHSEKQSDNQSQEQEGGAVTAVSDFTANNSPIITETQPTEVNFQESEANNNTGTFKVSCGKSKCNKLCCYTGVNTSPQMEEENAQVAKAQYSLDATESAKMVFNQTQKEIHTPQKVSSTLETEFKVKVSSPIGLEKTLLRVAKSNEDTSAGTVTPRSSTRHIPVINLTDSPVELVKETTRKSDLRRTTMDCKSPILQSFQKRNSLRSSLDGSVVIDLISDDEDDYTCFVDRVLKKYGVTSKSPQQSPRIRTPLASIGNIPRLSSSMCRTPQSPLANSPAKKNLILPAKFISNMNSSQASSQELSANKDVPSVVNSPVKTPVSPMSSLPMVHVSPPAESLQTVKDVTPDKITLEIPIEKVLIDTPRKTPRRRNALKEIETEEVASPLRVMSLRTRNISVSPSPKKVTPRKTPSRRKAAKELLTEINDNVNLLSAMKLNEIDINACSSPKEIIPQIETSSCKTPLRRNLAKEAVAEEASEDTGHLRVMSLRSRNVSVSPSPKKMASRRKKNDNQRV